ncbi:helix-turn-helix domain-containing protein [Cnuibacter sp. UC19_7]|uniref:helix-turn-helix domain-containing protein n=1 Tax=Cnuibacter sp. UC19_7 TaxID=3350166 RepID=UPI00366D1A6D
MTAANSDAERRMLALAREDGRVSQQQLAKRAGTSQPAVAAIEVGTRRASPELLERLFDAVALRPSVALAVLADDIVALAASHGLVELRVIGSTARGDDVRGSDLDLLARYDAAAGVDVVTMLAFVPRASALLACRVDLVLEPAEIDGPAVPVAGFAPLPRVERARPSGAAGQLAALRQLVHRLDDVTLEQLARPDGAVALRVEATLARVADAVERLPEEVRVRVPDGLVDGLLAAPRVLRGGLEPSVAMRLLDELPAALRALDPER